MKNLARLFLLIILAVIASTFIFSDFDLSQKTHNSITASVGVE
ncbi:hypothetical protein [Bizionia argentinensis]|nr:hypothetical protein [Bizionia argentinensis]